MHKTTVFECDNKISVNINELMAMTGTGRGSAEKIAAAAGAVIRIGRRKLYNVQKIQQYMNNISAGTNNN